VGLMTLPISEPDANFLLTISDQGFVKRTPIRAFVNRRPSGMRAASPNDGERIIHASVTDGGATVVLVSSGNRICRFVEVDVNPQGTTARGVRGIKLEAGETVCGCGTIPSGSASVDIIAATARGRFRRCEAGSIKRTGRDTRGFKVFSSIVTEDSLVGLAIIRHGQVLKYTTVLMRSGIIAPGTIPISEAADRGREVITLKANNPLSRVVGFDADVT